ncbi:cation:dicarboxylate symporter family transporter, partial [Streptococcus suis]
NLIRKIGIGVVLGVLLGLIAPKITVIALFGSLFVGALKAIAPLLVLTLVAHALSQAPAGQKSNMRTVICLYLFGTFAAAFIAVGASYLFPIKLVLSTTTTTDITPPQGIAEVFQDLLLKVVDNPINALATANYIGVLTWAAVFGLAFRHA